MTKQEDLSLSLSPSSSFAAAFLCFSLSIRPFVVQFSSSSCASFASFLFRLLPFLPVLDKQTGSTSIDGQREGGDLSPPRSTMTLSRCMIAPLLHGPSISRSRFPPPSPPVEMPVCKLFFTKKRGRGGGEGETQKQESLRWKILNWEREGGRRCFAPIRARGDLTAE